MNDTYYDVLGLQRSATKTEIKEAFRTLTKRWHPDVNPSIEAQNMMQKINRAYEVLGNSKKRAEYDFDLYYRDALASSHGYNATAASSYTGSTSTAHEDDADDTDSTPWYWYWVAIMLMTHLFKACVQ